MTTVYVTKWALTKGILKKTTPDPTDHTGVRIDSLLNWICKPDWHTTYAAALAHAQQLRLDALASACQTVADLAALTFKVEE